MTEKRFIEQFEENVQKYPDKVILRDEHNSLTFRELDELSGRVYAYLKEKGIGREDFVMISLPRGVEVVAAMMGVWKAGAALLTVVDNLPENRKNFIYSDCSCQMEIKNTNWEEVCGYSVRIGFEQTDKHDAAFVAYTSGSEGQPRGFLHEYGKLELFIKGWCLNGESILQKEDVAAMPFPLQGTLFICSILNALAVGHTYDILPIALLSNPCAFGQYLIERKATFTCSTSSHLAQYPLHSPYLRFVFLAMQSADNIGEYPYELINAYGQTEGTTVCLYRTKQKMSLVPIGVPTDACEGLVLLNDVGERVLNGEIGELCYDNPYTRGYVNQPGITKEAFRFGKFHSGDIARINEDGNYVILGRKSDMIKINGNRIEPVEIEAAVKKVLGIDWAFAKGFVEPERSYIVVYYTAPINIDYASVREELMKVLPTYMIPSYFVHLDEVPHLPNGKVDRQALRAPDIEQYRAPYAAPENELEARLCQAMYEVIYHTPSSSEGAWGCLDDFYLLGGDSLRTIELVTKLDIEDLTVADIYAARTPRAIAERWMKKMMA